MATVRITDHIKQRIRANVRDLFTAFSVECMKKISEQGDLIYTYLIPENIRKKMDELPDGYFEKVSDYGVSFVWASDSYTTFNVRVTDKVKMPNHMTKYGTDSRTISLTDEKYAPLAAIILPIVKAYEENNARMATMMSHVDEIMGDNGTIGLCVKAWPQFLEIIPSDLRAKHAEVTTRENKTKAELSQEAKDELNVLLMTSKLTGG